VRWLVSSAAVIWVVTQRFSPLSWGEALRDDPNNGCGGDYEMVGNVFPVSPNHLSFGKT